MKKSRLVKSLLVSFAVSVLLLGAGYFLLVDGDNDFVTGRLVEASSNEQESNTKSELNQAIDIEKVLASSIMVEDDEADDSDKQEQSKSAPEPLPEPEAPVISQSSNSENQSQPVQQQTASAPTVENAVQPVVVQNSQPQPVETKNEQPASVPDPVVEEAVEVVVEAAVPASKPPVTYSWGSSRNYTFRTEVKVTNNGSATSNNVVVSVPLLESSSPYQTISLKSTNYSVASSSGRVSTFNLGDIAPGETKTIVADMNVTVRTVSINSTNDTVEKARQVYEQFRGSGNCRTLAQGFINKSREMGITAREVVGYARPERGAMTSGSLQGTRHSWAEFYVDGLGWVPVDLTFQYFGEFPHTSHIVEGYGDQSISINYSGGSLGASWSNQIL